MSDTPDNSAPVLATRDHRAGPITDGEWAVVLATLAEHGPEAAKLVIARGRVTARGVPSRVRTLADLLERDPRKRDEWETALGEFVSRFVAEAQKSALTPEVIERFDRKTGQLVERRVSRRDMNWMLIHVLRKLSPDWREQKRLAVDGKVEHSHTLGTSSHVYQLTAADVLALPEADQSELFRMLEQVEQNRAAAARPEPRYELIDEPQRASESLALEAVSRPADGGGEG
jgi:hypothetical protein